MMTTNRMIYGLRAAVYGLCCAALLLALGGPARAFEYNPLPDSLMNVSLPVGQQERRSWRAIDHGVHVQTGRVNGPFSWRCFDDERRAF